MPLKRIPLITRLERSALSGATSPWAGRATNLEEDGDRCFKNGGEEGGGATEGW